jgi:predicted Zn-dependent protease
VARYAGIDDKAALSWITRHRAKASPSVRPAFDYGQALVYLDNEQSDKAAPILHRLVQSAPQNLFYLDALSDLYIDQGKPEKSVALLQQRLAESPNNAVLTINYANALMKAKQYRKAILVLQRYTHDYPDDTIGWSLLSEANVHAGNRQEDLAARAELLALKADWDQAIRYYTQASQLAKLGSLEQARYDARIDQLTVQRKQFLSLEK